ncbi:retrovirus-related pol polyprotein from transposon TNT 1-94 [Tanacetum coccineum]
MTTMAENVIAVGTDNRPSMLEKSMYNSWKSCMKLYIRGKEHGKDLLNSVLYEPFQYGTVIEDGITRLRTYKEITDKEKIRDEFLQKKFGIESSYLWKALNCHCKNVNLEWSKFVTDVKLARDMHESNFDQLYAYLRQHDVHANEVPPIHAPVINSPPVVPQQAYQAPAVQQKPQAVFPQLDSGLVVPSFLPGDDPIASLNKAMTFISTSISSRNRSKSIANSLGGTRNTGTNVANQTRVIRCYNCRGEGHMARQCTHPKRLRNYEWFKEKMLLTDDLDAFDSDRDEASSARAVLMANLSSYDSDVLSKENAMIMSIIDEMSNQVSKCNAVNLKNNTMDESLTAKLERYEEQIKNFEERQKVDLTDREKYIDSQMQEMIVNRNAKFAAFENKIHTLKLRLSKNMEDDNKIFTTTMDVLKKETKEKEDKYIEEILIISQDLIHTVVNSYVAIVDYVNMEKSYLDEYNKCLELKAELSKKNEMVEKANALEFKEFFKINNLKAQLEGKDTSISNLKKHIANLKGKVIADCSKFLNDSRVTAHGMYKLDLQPLSSTLRKNKEVHEDYLKVTKEHADTLRRIVEQDRDLEPSDNELDYADQIRSLLLPPASQLTKQLAARRNQERVKSILLLAIPEEYFSSFTCCKMLNHTGEDINQKFLRSLPSLWNQIALITRNKPDIMILILIDLYNNLRVYEDEYEKVFSTASEDFGVSTASGINQVPSTPRAHGVAYSFLAQPTTSPQLENEDF